MDEYVHKGMRQIWVQLELKHWGCMHWADLVVVKRLQNIGVETWIGAGSALLHSVLSLNGARIKLSCCSLHPSARLSRDPDWNSFLQSSFHITPFCGLFLYFGSWWYISPFTRNPSAGSLYISDPDWNSLLLSFSRNSLLRALSISFASFLILNSL